MHNNISIWLVDIKAHYLHVSVYKKFLSPREIARANRFQFEKDHHVFVITRGILRILLSRYLQCQPEVVQLTENDHGKPGLLQKSCHFNLSHSGDYALIAIDQPYEVGVDIQYMADKVARDDVAKRFFHSLEYQAYLTLPIDQKKIGFYRVWTRKEAIIKALGQGIFFGLQKFAVNVAKTAKLLYLDAERDLSAWQLHELNLKEICPDCAEIENYCAAIAWRGPLVPLQVFEYP